MFDIIGTRELINKFLQDGTVARIKEWIGHEASTSKKFHCPFCEKRVTVYHRPIHREMGEFLIKLYINDRTYSRFYTMRELDPDATKSASDGVYLVHWSLIERATKLNAPPNSYRITDKGKAFVSGQLTVPSHCHMLNNNVVGWSDRPIHIKEIINNYEDFLYR